MAILYFSNNADSGTGSLRATIASAQPGDVIRPDETVFERGSTIEIVLAATLTLDKNLTLDGGPFRVRLNADGRARCVALAENANVEMTAFDVVGGGWNSQTNADVGNAAGAGLYVPGGSKIALNRCGFFACRGTYGGAIAVGTGAAATLNDCVIAGCYARGSGAGLRSVGNVSVYGSTIIGNVEVSPGTSADILADGSGAGRVTLVNSIVGKYRRNVEIGDGCVVGVASSQIGFVAPPPDDLTAETWTTDAWQNWDLRLLDDASPNPSPYRDSGDVDAASKYDLDGNFRGRESGGASTCSPGAYETIQADLFWVGVDANGAEVVSPSFLTSDGWAASRFATVSGDAAPQVGQTLFVGRDVAFVDALATSSNQRHGLYVGGGTVVAFESDARLFLGKLQIAANARLAFNRGAAESSRFGAFSRVDGIFTSLPNAVADDNVYIASAIFYGTVISEPTYGTLNVLTSADVSVERMSGVYVCNAFQIQQNGTKVGQTIIVSDGTTIRARSVNFGSADAANYVESFFSRPVTLKLQGAASVSMPTTTRESWADDFVVDVTDATSATLTLCGQTVCGGAPTSEITLNGVAQADARGLDVASLALTADASLSVNGGKVCVAELSVADGATVAFFPVEQPDATDGANVIDETGATDKTTGTDATYVDAVLSATTSATVGAATFTGTGYFAPPQGTDVTAATFETSVRRVDYSAGVEAFAATVTGPTTATLVWSATDATTRVCVERENAAAPNGWEVVTTTPTEDASPLEVALQGRERFRIFDGSKFLYDEAYFAVKSFYVYKISSTQREVASYSLYSRKAQMVRANIEGSRNENVLLLAQIKNLLTGEYLTQKNVETIVASVYKIEKGVQSGDVWTEQEEWRKTEVPLDSLLESPIMIEGWTNDEVGANFVWTPNTMEKKLFTEGGKYVIQVTFNLPNENPIVISFNASVK